MSTHELIYDGNKDLFYPPEFSINFFSHEEGNASAQEKDRHTYTRTINFEIEECFFCLLIFSRSKKFKNK